MTRFAVFLRGINVGGVRITMKDLAAALAAAGYRRVITVLASGNVVLDADEDDAGSLGTALEALLGERFGYPARVVATTTARVAALVEAYPFPPIDDGVPRHDYVVLAASETAVASVMAAAPRPADGESFATGDSVLYWQVPRGESLSSPLAKVLARPQHKASLTTRNLNTLHKVLSRAAAGD
ncbi:MAG: DUF1697 domain-containing protein [Arthrobacter sp.]|uniref:DUF1697 domain-containing protein n=1 Tax=unclassified Arthrobacter TaxID=235627 RepID=UPI003FB9E416